MKVLHVVPALTLERGGPTTVICALARHQVAAGHDVHVLFTDQGARRGEHLPTLATGVNADRATVWGPDRLGFAPRFTALLRRRLQECDIVHIHSVFSATIHLALRGVLAARVPAIVRPCGVLDRYSLRRRRWLKRTYLMIWGEMVRRACACWHYTSAQEAAGSSLGETQPHFVLPNGIEPAEHALDRAAARARVAAAWPQLGTAPYVLFLARFHPKKRLDLLIESFLRGAPRPFKLVVAGPDECALWQPLADRFLARPETADRVVRLGMISGPDKVALLAAATLFALPSEHENFGNAALEAMATGTPVLLSPHVDLTGASWHPNWCARAPLDVASWAERFSALLADSVQLAAAAEPMRREIWRQYSWQRIAADLTECYRWVQSGCPMSAAGDVRRLLTDGANLFSRKG
jgi:glycosyltransferase involved in cell wall biosynthesis